MRAAEATHDAPQVSDGKDGGLFGLLSALLPNSTAAAGRRLQGAASEATGRVHKAGRQLGTGSSRAHLPWRFRGPKDAGALQG